MSSWRGVVLTTTARLLWGDRVGRVAEWAFTRGIPVRLEIRPEGLVVSSRTRFFAGAGRGPVALPWPQVVGVTASPRGHTGASGGLTLHETSDVTLDVTGEWTARWSPPDLARVLPATAGMLDRIGRSDSVPVTFVVSRGGDFAEAVRARLGGPATG